VADVLEILQRTSGSATFAELSGLTSTRSIRSALADRRIKRVAKGVYALPEEAEPLTVARAHGGVLSHESAALHWGFQVITRPLQPHVTIRRTQRRRATLLACTLHRGDAPVLDEATTPLRTVLDCARTLPLGEALAVADSAVRSGKVLKDELLRAATGLRGQGRLRVIRVADLADWRAESALESMLRARVIEAGYSGFVPQVVIADDGFYARVDLADPVLRIVLEADSFAHHGTREALRKDCRRHVNLAMRGWMLLRFSWEDVMLDDDWVGEALAGVIAGRSGKHNPVRRAA